MKSLTWYDYLIVFFAADNMSVGIVYGNPLFFCIGIILYVMHEYVRKQQVANDR